MDRVTTAQAALMAELIGDVTRLMKRAESFATTMDKAHEAMTNAAWLLDSRVEPFRHALAAEIGQTKDIAVKMFIRQTNEIAALEQKKQTEAIADTARAVIEKEMLQHLKKFTVALQGLISETDPAWLVWLTHVFTALVSGWFALHYLGR